jgi:hypothetical protein
MKLNKILTLNLLILVVFINYANANKQLLPRWELKVEITDTTLVNNPFIFSLTAKAIISSNTEIDIYLPPNISLLNGNTVWSGFLDEGDSTILTLTIRL